MAMSLQGIQLKWTLAIKVYFSYIRRHQRVSELVSRSASVFSSWSQNGSSNSRYHDLIGKCLTGENKESLPNTCLFWIRKIFPRSPAGPWNTVAYLNCRGRNQPLTPSDSKARHRCWQQEEWDMAAR